MDGELEQDAPAGGAEQLLGQAAAIDGQATAADTGAPAPGQPGAPAPVDWNQEARDLVDFCTGMFFPLYPRLATVHTPERCDVLKLRLAPVLKKYDLNMERLLGRWAPEIMLATVIAPTVLPTVKAIKDDLAELRAQQAEQQRAAPPKGAPAAPPPKSSDKPAAPPDPNQLHTLSKTGDQPGTIAPPPPDTTQLHNKA